MRDSEDGAYYVSNVGGDALEKDGNGFISKINAGGSIVIQKFIGGKKEDGVLNAPKGLAIVGRNIFVADIDTVKVFDKKTRKPSAIVDLTYHGAKLLNDIATDAVGNLYVSDTLTDRIFKIQPTTGYTVSVYASSPALSGPNGLLMNPRSRRLMVVTWGSGQVLEIGPAGALHVLKRGLTNLDGIDYDKNGNLYVSSFTKGEIYKISNYGRGKLNTHVTGLTAPADILYDRQKEELVVPSMKNNKVTTIKR